MSELDTGTNKKKHPEGYLGSNDLLTNNNNVISRTHKKPFHFVRNHKQEPTAILV